MSKSSRNAQMILFAATLASGIALLLHCANIPVAAAAQPKPDRLKTVLSQMDASSKTFRSAEADIQKQQFEKIVNDTSTETGKIYFLRNGNSIQFGGKFDPPSSQTVEYKNGVVRLYSAGTNHIDQVSAAGNNQSRVETFLTLGFGGTGADLAKVWTITDLGTEQIIDGGKSVTVEKLDLVSIDPGARANFTHITIWVDPVRDVSLKQVFYNPSGDTQTAIYSNIRLNQPVDLKAFAIKCKGACG
jgi:outer membrane lipoprotein-sorting protein